MKNQNTLAQSVGWVGLSSTRYFLSALRMWKSEFLRIHCYAYNACGSFMTFTAFHTFSLAWPFASINILLPNEITPMNIFKSLLYFIHYLLYCCSVAKSCPTLQPNGLKHAGFPVLHYLLRFAQTHFHCVDDVYLLKNKLTNSLFILIEGSMLRGKG